MNQMPQRIYDSLNRTLLSKREILRRERIHWETLKKILEYSEPPGYRLKEPRPKPKIGSYLERIAQIIEEDKALPSAHPRMGKFREPYGANVQSQTLKCLVYEGLRPTSPSS